MRSIRSQFGVLAITAALVTLLVISFFAFRDWKQYDASYAKATKARRIQLLNGDLIDSVREAEAGQRGFLLTGRLDYLAPYYTALNRIPAQGSELAGLVDQGSAQSGRVSQLQSLIAQKLVELRKTIEVRQSDGVAAALAVVETDQGKGFMESIRRISQEIERAENDRRLAAVTDLQAEARSVRIVTLSGAIFLAILVAIGGLLLKGSEAQLEDSKRSAEASRDLLQATLYSIGDGSDYNQSRRLRDHDELGGCTPHRLHRRGSSWTEY